MRSKSISRYLCKQFIAVGFLLFSYNVKAELSYKVAFGKCPVKVTGPFLKGLVEDFKKSHSLYKVKVTLEKKENKENFFYHYYKIHYLPGENILTLKVDCPSLAMKLQAFEGKKLKYEAVLSPEGEVIDPNYENHLRGEKQLSDILPIISLPIQNVKGATIKEGLKIFSDLSHKKNFSELSFDGTEWVAIFGHNFRPSTVFFGKEDLDQKAKNLNRILEYFSAGGNYPTLINMKYRKKIVVKFN